eukprot:2852837-Alexandrium_andersonii.AAC.1
MSASLVGSEMCIRDRNADPRTPVGVSARFPAEDIVSVEGQLIFLRCRCCLLYTSDAADDM